MHLPDVVVTCSWFLPSAVTGKGDSFLVLEVSAHLEKVIRGPQDYKGMYDQSEAWGLSQYAPEDHLKQM